MNAVKRFFADVLLRDWGTKSAALFLAVILFVLTRNEVSRTFQVPLRVEPDPDRVLVTDLPDTVAVEVRGPWTRVNRMQALDLGQVSLPLEQLRPGPLRIDPGSVVMPAGVVLESAVDLVRQQCEIVPPADLDQRLERAPIGHRARRVVR